MGKLNESWDAGKQKKVNTVQPFLYKFSHSRMNIIYCVLPGMRERTY
jgi:hypothetical protein